MVKNIEMKHVSTWGMLVSYLATTLFLGGCGEQRQQQPPMAQTAQNTWNNGNTQQQTPRCVDANGNQLPDSDGDNVCDEVEVADGLDPASPDSDGDGTQDNIDETPTGGGRSHSHMSPWAIAAISVGGLMVAGLAISNIFGTTQAEVQQSAQSFDRVPLDFKPTRIFNTHDEGDIITGSRQQTLERSNNVGGENFYRFWGFLDSQEVNVQVIFRWPHNLRVYNNTGSVPAASDAIAKGFLRIFPDQEQVQDDPEPGEGRFGSWVILDNAPPVPFSNSLFQTQASRNFFLEFLPNSTGGVDYGRFDLTAEVVGAQRKRFTGTSRLASSALEQCAGNNLFGLCGSKHTGNNFALNGVFTYLPPVAP